MGAVYLLSEAGQDIRNKPGVLQHAVTRRDNFPYRIPSKEKK
jgi:hypothetical protein